MLVLVGLLTACGEGESAVQAGRATRAPLTRFEPPLDPARKLVAYAWEGEGSVPASDGRLPEPLVYGEIGRSPDTRLYLGFEHALATELEGQDGWSPAHQGSAPGPGRFGSGIQLAAGEHLEFTRAEPLTACAWTIEFWFRPEKAENGVILSLGELLELVFEADGHVVARVNGHTPEGAACRTEVQSALRLVEGKWHHVGVVLDPFHIDSLRIVTNGLPRGERLKGEVTLDLARVTLGSSGARPTLAAAYDELRLQARAANTAEFEAHFLATPELRQRVRLDYADGSATHEFWSGALSEPRLGPGSDWTRGALVHARSTPEGLTLAAGDWQRIASLDPPLARTTVALAQVDDSTMFAFSGEVRDSHHGRATNPSDTWLFDAPSGRWTRIETAVRPPGRCHQQAAYSPDHDLVLMAGGWNNETMPGFFFADTWVFHVRERRWEERKPANPPAEFSDCPVVYSPAERAFIVLSSKKVSRYDPERDAWDVRPLHFAGKPDRKPEQLAFGPMCALDPRTGLVWLFGGFWRENGQDVFSDECSFLDLTTDTLTYIEGPRPSARVRGALAWDSTRERFTLFGGVLEQGSQRFDDLWTFEPDARRWLEHSQAGAITGRGGYYGMGYSRAEERFFLLNGRHSRERFQEDVWSLALDEEAEGSACYLFDRAAFAGETAWFLELEPGSEEHVQVSFRASEDGRAFGPVLRQCPADGRFVEVSLRLAPAGSGAPPRVRALGFRAPS